MLKFENADCRHLGTSNSSFPVASICFTGCVIWVYSYLWIYVLLEMDKNFQRYLASNTPKIRVFKIMAGRKEDGSNSALDIIAGGSRNAAYKNNTKI